jgi:hypothetical protein
MRLELTGEEVFAIQWKAEQEYLYAHGFQRGCEILRVEQHYQDTKDVKSIIYEQDNTPNIGGDNIECEYLKTMG